MTKHINAYVVIFSLVTVLALATASECHSITYLPSLLYGAVLWEWWGLIASALWKWGKQTCFLARPSVLAIAIQLLTGTALGIAHLLLLNALGNSLLNVNRLERLAKDRNLAPPAPGQLVHLNGKDSSVAMMQRQ